MDFYYQNVLKDELRKRQLRNKSYSLRSYARDLSVAPSWLSEVLNSKKGISKNKAVEITTKLGLRPKNSERFILSTESKFARSPKRRNGAIKDLIELMKDPESKNISQNELSQIKHWYQLVILDLLELTDYQPNIKWMGQKLGLTESEIKTSVDELIKMGWIKFENGEFIASFIEAETSFDEANTNINNIQNQHLDLAKVALNNQKVDQREFLTMTMPFDIKEMKEVKKYIRQFQSDFAKKFYSKKLSKNSIYQLSLQWVRLDKGNK